MKKKYNCSGPLALKNQGVERQSNQKLLPHYQHSEHRTSAQFIIVKS